jgi:hypothetical protein
MTIQMLQDLHHHYLSAGLAVPAAGLGLMGASITLCRHSIARLLPARTRDKSLMDFSSLGALHCVCGVQHPETLQADRRQTCRSCGCEIVPADPARLELQISRSEIKAMTRSLRRAALRASHLDLPPQVTTVHELHRYLNGGAAKTLKVATVEAAPVEQPQLH